MFRKTTHCLLLFLLFPLVVQAMPCHCYNVRDFDPQEPAAADPYYLTTGQNSFFSIMFGMEKKTVIFAKQKPRATAEELWVSHWLATTTGQDLMILKKAKKAEGSWPKALTTLNIDTGLFPAGFEKLLAAEASDKILAAFIVDELLRNKAKIPPQELEALRTAQASDQETILASLIAMKTTQPPSSLYRRVASGETTWGTLLLTSGMKGRDMVEEIGHLLGALPVAP